MKTSSLFMGGLFLILFTAITNIGIIAYDDYFFVIAQIIPAQKIILSKIIDGSFWSPVLPFVLALVSKLGFWFGIHQPINQLRFVLTVLGVSVFTLNSCFTFLLFKNEKNQKKEIAQFFLSFFYIAPLFFTRPLIEIACSPFLMGSAFFATQYWNKKKNFALNYAVILLSLASIIRFQAGVCYIALWLLIYLKKDRKVILSFLMMSLLCFVGTGWLDKVFSHEFHGTLMNYIRYNMGSGEGHGKQPFYVFIVLFLLVSIPPTFFSRYKYFKWRVEYSKFFPVLLYFIIFIFFHSLSPHKEERFALPVLPLFFVLITPLAHFLLKDGWRVRYFLTINTLLLVIVVLTVPQKNVIGLIQYLDKNIEIQKLYEVEDTLVLFPEAYSLRAIPNEKYNSQKLNCSAALVIRKDLLEKYPQQLKNLKLLQEFPSGVIDALLVRFNPKRNLRRNSILLYGCQS